MLSAVGEAGEKALPVFEKAKQQAKLAAAKAGEYALGKVAEDEATAKLEKEEMMKRENFYVVPKGKKGGPLGIAEAITQGKGEFVRVNKFELSKLDQNKNFNDNFEIVKASDYLDVAKEMMKAPEVKDQYSKTSKFIPLFSGADKDLGFYVQLPDANAGGNVKPAFVDDADSVIGQIQSMEQDLNRQEKDFKEIASLLNRTDIDVVSQLGQSVVQGFRNLGFDVGGDTTPIKQIQTLLTKLQAENAADILGESGKTLSDTDRKLVAEIVGGISFNEGDEEELTRKLGRLYEVIISKGRKNVNEAYSKLKSAGVNINRESVKADPTASLVKGDDGIYDIVS
jgi:predicted Fe-Mo cluster-binding NifX family protein